MRETKNLHCPECGGEIKVHYKISSPQENPYKVNEILFNQVIDRLECTVCKRDFTKKELSWWDVAEKLNRKVK